MLLPPPRKVLIVGCGYIGKPLALRLWEQGHEIHAWVHSAASAGALAGCRFHRVITGSVADPALWESLPGEFDLVIHAASSGRGGAEAYREVFLEGLRQINTRQSRARRLMVSSTSVYGQTAGEWVTEESLAEPATETGRILREAEKATLGSGGIVVRSAGIYGPGRSVLLEKFRKGEAVIEGDGDRWINQIHQRDLVAALEHLVQAGEPGQIYNAADNEPVTQRDFYAWCAEFLRQPMPLHGPVAVNRKRGLTNKRVANVKLRGAGWQPVYASFREGFPADYSPK
ncbi:MAG TPA: NAD-dependent epimerase/dehydratase family protein [Candidatus Methylacidiphilales bacterium]|nr:NAD-dependent epimerase/dehydratase family protein [Candidatus Methylacidiphilales bacterium]